MFARSNVAITGGNFMHINEARTDTAFEKLQAASAPNAFHDSSARFDPPKCHPNTRVVILEYLMGWIFGRNDPDALILWLYGPAGAGKSAVLQTIAEHCFERKILLASFFFSRSDPTRNHFKPLIATIAYQIGLVIPEVKPLIESAIEHDPFIFDKSIATQLQRLIIEPLKGLTASGYFKNLEACARLILIDGLDECEDPRMQSLILRALANALHDKGFPLIFLVASRPEQDITHTFNSPSVSGIWHSLVLDDSFSPDDDVHLFLTDSFRQIKTMHPLYHLISEAWPKPSDIDELVSKSSGQFIYASVVVKYVSAHDDRPPDRLEVVMGLRPARREVPFAELDALYMHLLDSCPDPETVLRILGCVISNITRSIPVIEFLLDLEPGDVDIALAPLKSIITTVNIFPEGPVLLPSHASFRDFLIDISRSSRFHINTLTIQESIPSIYFKTLMHPPSISGNIVEQRQALHYMLDQRFHNSSLTPTMEHVVIKLSLPRIWASWSPPPGIEFGLDTRRLSHVRAMIVCDFLQLLKFNQTGFADSNCHKLRKIYTDHHSAFESTLKSEISKYFQDTGLMTLITYAFVSDRKDMRKEPMYFPRFETIRSLLQLTKESTIVDANSLNLLYSGDGAGILFSHLLYLFATPTKSVELWIDGSTYAHTALRILEFLCAHPPHSISSRKFTRKSQTLKAFSRLGTHSKRTPHLLPHCSRSQQQTDIRFLRKRREQKHCLGAALTPSPALTPGQAADLMIDTEYQYYDGDLFSSLTLKVHTSCRVGLDILPEMLQLSSASHELVDYIRTHGKDIAFWPKLTRNAIRAMHEYLGQAEEAFVEVGELSDRFAAMVI